MRVVFILLFSLLFNSGFTQTYQLSGSIQDAADKSSLISAAVSITAGRDSVVLQSVATDVDGKFLFTGLKSGFYRLKVSYVGYSSFMLPVKIEGTNKELGVLKVTQNATTLKDVNVTETATRVVQKNDTSEYNANAYKTNKDANAEDLVTKMPGISSENGTVKAHGEQVQKVTVDGRDFFGDDATLALKNLPAEIVDKVQVFDRMSDQARFTGFDDGNSQKSMNIQTKKGKNNGVFGKLYAGYGYINDSKYSAGATINWFNGDRRISLLGLTNNINIQNFASQDLLGISGASSRGGGMGGGGGRGGMGGGGGAASNNFLVGQQSGIATTNSVGLNYSDVLGKKKNLKLSGSYFFNQTDNVNGTLLSRKYFSNNDKTVAYNEENDSKTRNRNHRINLRMEYTIDSMNSIIFTPKFSYQENTLQNTIDGKNSTSEATLLSATKSNYTSYNAGYNAGADLLYQHKFKKASRTISVNVGTTINNKKGNTTQYALNNYYTQNDSTILDQKANNTSTSYQVNGNITYTEPIDKNSMMQFSYAPSYTWNKADKQTFDIDSAGAYSQLNKQLSNKYDNDYMTHRVGMTYRLKGTQFDFMAGMTVQYALLTGESIYPLAFSTHRSFNNLLPNAMFNYKFKDNSSLRIYYRTSTNAPSVSQLQSVVDNSNPLLLSTGNRNLNQTYGHFLMVRYGLTKSKKGHSFFAFGSLNATQSYIANSTFIASKDTLLSDNILLRAGSQLSKPVNLNGNFNANAFLTYGLPINAIKCNLNLSAGFAFGRTPGLINTRLNYANTYVPTAGLVLGSNINEKIDFTISYSGSYNVVKNSLQRNADNNYFTHSANLKFNWLFWKGFVYNTTLQNTLYQGVSNGFNQNIFLWNMSLGYKFLKDKSLEVKMGVNDILNQNSGISRSITETYVQDTRTQVLQRFWMLTITFNLRYFKGMDMSKQTQQQPDNRMMPAMPPGGFPGGGMGGNPHGM